jgi:chromosomal replication initiation ATPase DnaA
MISFEKGSPVGVVKMGKKKKVIGIIPAFGDGYTKDGRKNLELGEKGEIQLAPSPKAEVCYAAASSGSGKSWLAAGYAKNFKKMYPNEKVFVFSRLLEDEAFDDLDICRIPVDDGLIKEPLDYNSEMPNNSLVIFDDFACIAEKQLRETVISILTDMLQTYRHKNMYLFITNHTLVPSRKNGLSDIIFTELHRLIIFPCGGDRQTMVRILKNKFGIPEKRGAELLKKETRWLCFSKNNPQYMMWSKGIIIL